jgi:hypothetical protein
MKRKWRIGAITLTAFLMLAACKDESGADLTHEESTQEETGESTEHAQMNSSKTGDLPENLREAEDPKFPVGSNVLIGAEYTNGTEAVEGTVIGAYETAAYTVSYESSNDGENVENYKWVIHEEIEEAGADLFARGEKVVLNASHMPGMHGADAYIESVEATTVYMVDYVSANGEKVKNHKWIIEEELSKK